MKNLSMAKTKALSLVLSLAMLFGILPMSTLAQDGNSGEPQNSGAIDFTLDFTADAGAWEYGVPFGGVENDSASEEMGWKWKADTKTLTLEDFSFVTNADS